MSIISNFRTTVTTTTTVEDLTVRSQTPDFGFPVFDFVVSDDFDDEDFDCDCMDDYEDEDYSELDELFGIDESGEDATPAPAGTPITVQVTVGEGGYTSTFTYPSVEAFSRAIVSTQSFYLTGDEVTVKITKS